MSISSKICKYEIDDADDSKVNRADQLEYLTLNDKQKLKILDLASFF